MRNLTLLAAAICFAFAGLQAQTAQQQTTVTCTPVFNTVKCSDGSSARRVGNFVYYTAPPAAPAPPMRIYNEGGFTYNSDGTFSYTAPSYTYIQPIPQPVQPVQIQPIQPFQY